MSRFFGESFNKNSLKFWHIFDRKILVKKAMVMTQKAHNSHITQIFFAHFAVDSHTRTLEGGGGKYTLLNENDSHIDLSKSSESTSYYLDCFGVLQKSINDRVGGIVIARHCKRPSNLKKIKSAQFVIARFCYAKSWQSKQNKTTRSANLLHAVILRAIARSIHFSDLKSKAICGLYTNLNAIALIHSYIIDFIHCFKLCALDTSLRNATLSMTSGGEDSHILDCHALPKASLAMTLSSNDSHKSSRFIVRNDFKLYFNLKDRKWRN